jgi:hypothetical protein
MLEALSLLILASPIGQAVPTASSLFTFVFAALVSLAPIGGEGRGEGAGVDAEANRRRSCGAREDGFSADSAIGARLPTLTLSPDGGEGTPDRNPTEGTVRMQ